jgi:hypothetical protein
LRILDLVIAGDVVLLRLSEEFFISAIGSLKHASQTDETVAPAQSH